MKIIRLTVTDRPVRRYTRDSRLDAVPPGKVLAAGVLWTGELKPLLDGYVAALEPLVTGFTSGRVLHAEPSSATLDLGRVWVGEMRSAIHDAVAAHREGPEDVDVSEVLEAVETLHTALGTKPATFTRIADGLKRLKGAADAVTRHTTRTSDALRRNPMLAPRHTVGDGSRPPSPAQINADNLEFWRKQDAATRTIDSHSSAIRDAEAAVRWARTPYEKLEAMNSLNRLASAPVR